MIRLTVFAIAALAAAPAVAQTEPRPYNPLSGTVPNDYPSEAIREGRGGLAQYTLAIDARGRVTNCTITESTGSTDLDEQTCKGMRRVRFHPATSAQGERVPGEYIGRYRWVIPRN